MQRWEWIKYSAKYCEAPLTGMGQGVTGVRPNLSRSASNLKNWVSRLGTIITLYGYEHLLTIKAFVNWSRIRPDALHRD